MNKAMYYIGLVLAIVSIMGGIVAGVFIDISGFIVALLGYILMVLLDLTDKYLERNQ